MAPEPLSLAVEAFGVVGVTDVVFRSVIGLANLVSAARSSNATAQLLLSVLNSLAAALGEVRIWADGYVQSDFASHHGQVLPHHLVPLLQRCSAELDDLRCGMGGVFQPRTGVWQWMSDVRFAWSEAKLRQSIQVLEGYKTSLLLLVSSRTAYVPYLVHFT